MKLKKWLSRGLVLAMVLALMVPVPVAAKSNGGGKLVKSVERYTVNSAGNWQLDSKVAYSYDKKNNPKEIKSTGYYQYWLGVPVGGDSDVSTLTYKYKGKTPKSMVAKDSAGFVSYKSTYKKGKVVKSESIDKSATQAKDGTVSARITTNNTFAVYNKSGLATAVSSQSSTTKSDGSVTNTSNDSVYAYVQKKGIPSLILCNDTYTDKEGTTDPYTTYTKLNNKGLAIEYGYVDSEKGTYVPEVAITYTMKKGNVKEAVVYTVDEKGTPTPSMMFKFKYTKTKISKARYMNMINSFLMYEDDDDYYNATNGFWNWF